jgi:UDP-N-acetylmuramate dehydrogenase
MKYKNYLKTLDPKDAVVFYNESLKKHCSFFIGGKAKYFVVVNNIKTLTILLEKNKNKKFFILGAGTNVLFKDNFYNGTIIKLGENFKKIKIKKTDSETVIAEIGAGVNLFTLNYFLKKNGIGGLEWSYGIPGSVGGATLMNAGSYDHEFGEFLYSVKIWKNGKISWIKNFTYSYRTSSFKTNGEIILGVRLKLKRRNVEEIEKDQNFFFNKKKESQPYDKKSAGSVFKRIINSQETFYPAKIIDNLGLKGVKIGGAEISEKHAGFIISNGKAKSKHVKKLIKLIKRKVKNETGKALEEEIIIF